MILRFSSGSSTPASRARKRSCAWTCTSGTWKCPRERLDHLLGLVLAQQPVVDEDARELVADRLVHEQRGDGGVDPAREPADHPLAADLRADALDLLLDDGGRRPRGRRAGDVVEEPLQDLLAVRRVHDLGVELDAVELARVVLEGGDRRRRRARRRPRAPAGGAVTESRWLIQTVCSRGKLAEQRRLLRLELGLAVLGDVVRLDLAAELARHQLHPVADAERGHAELEDARGRRRARPRRRPTRGRRRGSARAGSAADLLGRVMRWPTSSE